MAEAWPWILVAAGAAVTYAWRGAGVALSGRIAPDGPAFRWFTSVAYALLAGLIARMIVLPLGPLQATALVDRLGATALAIACYVASRRSLLLSVAVGAVAIVLLQLARTDGFG